MSILVLADHDNGQLAGATLNTVAAELSNEKFEFVDYGFFSFLTK